jgi:hypothetical protein
LKVRIPKRRGPPLHAPIVIASPQRAMRSAIEPARVPLPAIAAPRAVVLSLA